MKKPSHVLEDLRVVEFVKSNSGALLCGRMLAELGADVMMVEPPTGHAYRCIRGRQSRKAKCGG